MSYSFGTAQPRSRAQHRRHDEPVGGPNGYEVRAAERAVEPHERRDDAAPLASVVEYTS